MTERCSLWSALSAAACCFYRGSFVQVQVRGRLGPAKRSGLGLRPLRPGPGDREPQPGGASQGLAGQGQGQGLREGAGSPQPHLWATGRSAG